MKKPLHLFSIMIAFLTAGCAKVGLFAANLPTSFNDIKVERDIAYGSDPAQKLDIYIPELQNQGVVVFFYGGRWRSGAKEDYSFVGSALAEKGFVTVIPDYRKYPDVKFPVFVQDGAKAVAWTIDNISSYGGNASKLHISGHSSGAHIGALVSVNPEYLRAEGKDRSMIRDFVGLSGPYAFIPDEDDLKDMFGPPERYPLMQVSTFIDGTQPPMLLLYGAKDTLVHMINIDRVKNAVDEEGGDLQVKIYSELDHVWMIGSLAWFGKNKSTVLQDMLDYMTKTPSGNLSGNN